MSQISAFVITCDKRPEDILHAVVKRIKWADQVVIVDKGREPISTFPSWVADCTYIRLDWSPIVEPSRNAALDACVHDWVVSVDDDEILSPDCERVFRDFVETGTSDVLEIPIRHYILGRFDRNTPNWPEWRPTLHRKGSLAYSSRLHAGIAPSTGAKVVCLHEEAPAYIDHLSHANVSQYLEKTNRYTDWPDRPRAGRIETDYVGAVSWLRDNYNKIDALKRWEQENLPDGNEEFLRIAQGVLLNG